MSYPTTLGLSTTAPTTGQTITIFNSSTWDRAATPITEIGKRLLFKLDSSHDSASNGVIVEFSTDGSTWVAAPTFPLTYTASNGLQVYDILLADNYVRVKYTNSANTLSKWKIFLSLEQDRSAAA